MPPAARPFSSKILPSRGCRLDPSGLADAAVWLREAVQSRPDMRFVNRFGRQEAAGQGLRSEIAEAVSRHPHCRPCRERASARLGTVYGRQQRGPRDAVALEAWCLAQAFGGAAESRPTTACLHQTGCAAD